ncbi:hypothetical protein P7C70_g5361, partial [Phenoliferia sp. Uapishka_3]
MNMDSKKIPLPNDAFPEEAPPAYETETLLNTTGLVPTRQMQVGGARNAMSLQVGLDGKRSFNHGLCEFYEEPLTALNAICCPCVVYSSNHSRLTHLSATGKPNESPSRVGVWCALYALGPQFFGVGSSILQCFSRLQTRQRYGIRGDMVQDALVAGFCVPCSLVQESREIDDEENALREGGEAPDTFYRDEPAEVVEGQETA